MAYVSLVKMWFVCHPHLGSGVMVDMSQSSSSKLCPEAEKSFMSKMTHLMMMKTLNWKGEMSI